MPTREPYLLGRLSLPYRKKVTQARPFVGYDSSMANFLGDPSVSAESSSALHVMPLRPRRAIIAHSPAWSYDTKPSDKDIWKEKSIPPLPQIDETPNPSRSNSTSSHRRLMAGFRSVFFTPGRRVLRQYEDSGVRFEAHSPGFVDVPPAYTDV